MPRLQSSFVFEEKLNVSKSNNGSIFISLNFLVSKDTQAEKRLFAYKKVWADRRLRFRNAGLGYSSLRRKNSKESFHFRGAKKTRALTSPADRQLACSVVYLSVDSSSNISRSCTYMYARDVIEQTHSTEQLLFSSSFSSHIAPSSISRLISFLLWASLYFYLRFSSFPASFIFPYKLYVVKKKSTSIRVGLIDKY